MMKINMILSCMLLWLVSACTSQEVVEITVSPEVTNAGYIGNGAEWDPYDEAEAWKFKLNPFTGNCTINCKFAAR